MAWLPNLRALLTLARAMQGCEKQLTRIANHLEGVDPPVPPVEDPGAVLAQDDTDFTRIEAARETLAPLLGRDPTEDEIAKELAGEEWGDDDQPVLPAALRAIRNGGRLQ